MEECGGGGLNDKGECKISTRVKKRKGESFIVGV